VLFDSNEGIVVCMDNLTWMATLPNASCDLIYIDPPFFTGRSLQQTFSTHQYSDHWPGGLEGYLSFLRPRLIEMRRLVKTTGTVLVHLDWRAVHYVKVMMDELFGYDQFLNEIVWAYRTGGVSKRWFGRKHDTILAYAAKKGAQTFHVIREGRFRTDGLKYDEQGRPYKETLKGRLYFHSDGPALTDVWEIPFLSTVSSERTGYPTQKPLALLNRLIQAMSNPGDVVADFFCGSGTTAMAAQALGRRFIACDESTAAAQITASRLKTAENADRAKAAH
jgi:DNA modification methylase